MTEERYSYARIANLRLLEELYEAYQKDPSSVHKSWHAFFKNLETTPSSPEKTTDPPSVGDCRIFLLIQAYRTFGYLMAHFNPVATKEPQEAKMLSLEALGFKDEELSHSFSTFGVLPQATAPLSEILSVLKETYCQKIGVEYMGLQNPDLEAWLQSRIEPNRFQAKLTMEEKHLLLQQLNRSELFELFLHMKYVGQMRFSLEGEETLIPLLSVLLEKGAQLGITDCFIGMAHRGRLNVLANVLNKSYETIFHEFEGTHDPEALLEDVKYHKGYFSKVRTEKGQDVKVTMTPNPSHLESVNPVVEGQTRACQVQNGDEVDKVLPILIHGDAAISGQGIVYEEMQLYKLPGYGTGGTVHIVLNNQIGFTSLPEETRSTPHCTDIAKTFAAPVFHVNAEDPEGCLYATCLALEIRQLFHIDVFIDLNGYRKHGHNEGDEPSFTQPLEYQLIRQKKTIRQLYLDELIHQGLYEKKMAEELEAEFMKNLQLMHEKIKKEGKEERPVPFQNLTPEEREIFPKTAVSPDEIAQIAEKLSQLPSDFKAHKKLQKLLNDRRQMVSGDPKAKTIDWGMGEILAYATLVWEGVPVRLSGQDTQRGTFSHRHAVLVDQEQSMKYFPLSHLKEGQARCDILNSPLSEFAVLAFEYGYSLAYPSALVIWEAQYGDFCNGAQIPIDEYITTAEHKWGVKSGLTLFLPHGYEGQGPDHSSGRMERFLELCAAGNMVVAYPTTPAQFFHLLRRQALRKVLKPLIVFTPKALLRHPDCRSSLEEFTGGKFQEVLDEEHCPAKRLLLCTGRIYYDLAAERKKRGRDDVAIVRLEQLYPLPSEALGAVLKSYPFEECFWVQEEPSNMGAYPSLRAPLEQLLLPFKKQLRYVGGKRSASPALGSYTMYVEDHQRIVQQSFE